MRPTHLVIAAATVLALSLSACDNRSTSEEVSDGVNDALDRRPAEGIRDAGEDAADAIEDAAKDAKKAVQ